MLSLIATLVFAQVVPWMAPEDPWRCKGLGEAELGPGNTFVPLGFSKSGRFAFGERKAYVDLMYTKFYDRAVHVVDLRTDKVLKEERDGRKVAEGFESILKTHGIDQTCPSLDATALEVTLKNGSGSATELWLKTALGRKRVTVIDEKSPNAHPLKLLGTVTSPVEQRAAILLARVDSGAEAQWRVKELLAFGASLKDGFVDDKPPDFAVLKPMLEAPGVAAANGALWPVGFSPEGHFAWIRRTPTETRFESVDLVTSTPLGGYTLEAGKSVYEGVAAHERVLRELAERRVIVQPLRAVVLENFEVKITGSTVWLARKKPAGKKEAGKIYDDEVTLIAVYQSPYESRLALVFTLKTRPSPPGQSADAREVRVLGVQTSGAFPP